jgi:signal transduction histidine kinase
MTPSVTDIDQSIEEVSSLTRGKRVLLIVDDDVGVREALSMIFRNDYLLIVAENGYEAIEISRTKKLDAVVLDIRMPGISGIETLSQLKKIDPGLEVIILTAFETIETAREALRLGACDYLSKPCDVVRVREAVEHAMKRRSISNEIQAHHRRLTELQEEIQNQQLKEDLARTKTEIYASVLHDINGPLTVIAGFLDLMAQDLDSAVRLEGAALTVHKNNLDTIKRQVDTCQEISRRYLSFLKGRPNSKHPTRVNQALHDLGQLLKIHPQARRNKLTIVPLANDTVASVNATDLVQILVNLTVNGLQSTTRYHEVEVKAEVLDQMEELALGNPAEERLFNLGALKNLGSTLKLSIRDDGPGIPPDLMDRIFEPYFTTKPEGSGTGLGLPIVRRLIEQSRGALHLRSAPGHGTVFTVFLPI